MFDHTLFSSEWYNIRQQITLLTQIHTTNLTLCSLLYYLSCVFQVLGISVQVSAPGIVLCLDIEKSSFATEHIELTSAFQLLRRSFTGWGLRGDISFP